MPSVSEISTRSMRRLFALAQRLELRGIIARGRDHKRQPRAKVFARKAEAQAARGTEEEGGL
jgi:hypothetical protein